MGRYNKTKAKENKKGGKKWEKAMRRRKMMSKD
jgi:hypothetical protein